MKICFPVSKVNGMESEVYGHFGSAPSFVVIDTEFNEKIPEDIMVIAVEAEDITTISDKCTPKVEKAIPGIIQLIKGLT